MAENYILITDSSCDMPEEYIAENDIHWMQLSIILDNKSYACNELYPEDFYNIMRGGQMPTTTQVNVEQMVDCFEPFLKQGKDVLYLGFSSGLSGTFHSGQVAAKKLQLKYPDRKMIVVDTLCASMGQGLHLHKVNQLRKAGKSIEEAAQWARDNIQRVIHLVTVDDLMHLFRGGRVSRTSAVVGSMLGIKPMIIMDTLGKLKVVNKVRGRKQSLNAVVDMAEACGAGRVENDICFISHGDCEEDAKYVAELVKKRFGINEFRINYVGPVIGAHTGPGVIALFLMGEKRE